MGMVHSVWFFVCLFVFFVFVLLVFLGGEKGQFLKWLQSASKVRARHIVFLSG